MSSGVDIYELCQRDNPGLQWTIGGIVVTIGSLCNVLQRLKPSSSRFTWAAVSRALGISKAATSASTILKRRYEQYIRPYELITGALTDNEATTYLEQCVMYQQLANKLITVPSPHFANRGQEIFQLQTSLTMPMQATKKPKVETSQLPMSLCSGDHSLTLCGEQQPLTDDFLASLLQRIDGITSLTLGPLHHVTTVPPFNLLHQSLTELIIYDLPAHIIEDVYDMALEQLPKLHTLHLINTSHKACAPPRSQLPRGSQSVNVKVDISLW